MSLKYANFRVMKLSALSPGDIVLIFVCRQSGFWHFLPTAFDGYHVPLLLSVKREHTQHGPVLAMHLYPDLSSNEFYLQQLLQNASIKHNVRAIVNGLPLPDSNKVSGIDLVFAQQQVLSRYKSQLLQDRAPDERSQLSSSRPMTTGGFTHAVLETVRPPDDRGVFVVFGAVTCGYTQRALALVSARSGSIVYKTVLFSSMHPTSTIDRDLSTSDCLAGVKNVPNFQDFKTELMQVLQTERVTMPCVFHVTFGDVQHVGGYTELNELLSRT